MGHVNVMDPGEVTGAIKKYLQDQVTMMILDNISADVNTEDLAPEYMQLSNSASLFSEPIVTQFLLLRVVYVLAQGSQQLF